MNKYIYFSNKSRCLSINEKACQHLFIRLTNDDLLINSFNEKGLFKHRLEKNKFVDIKRDEIKSLAFIKSNGILWLKIKLKLDDLIIAPKSWKLKSAQEFIDELNQIISIDNYNLYEKYLKK